MRNFICFLTLLVLASPLDAGEIAPEDILKAIDQMTPEQAHEVEAKLAKRQWDPVPGGFFERLALNGSIAVLTMDEIDLDAFKLSTGEDLELEALGGSQMSIMWRLFSERFRAGFKFAGYMAEDSDMGPGGYSSVELTNDTAAITANYQIIRSNSFLWWTEASLGGGNLAMEIIDTPVGEATSVRHLKKEYGFGELASGIAWRFNSKLSLNGFAGYQFADEIELEEGGKSTGIELEPKGWKAGLGLSYNF